MTVSKKIFAAGVLCLCAGLSLLAAGYRLLARNSTSSSGETAAPPASSVSTLTPQPLPGTTRSVGDVATKAGNPQSQQDTEEREEVPPFPNSMITENDGQAALAANSAKKVVPLPQLSPEQAMQTLANPAGIDLASEIEIQNAVNSLARLGTREALQFLREMAERSPHEFVRLASARAIGLSLTKAAPHAHADNTGSNATGTPANSEVSAAASDAEESATIEALARIATGDGSAAVREAAITALANAGSDAAFTALASIWNNTDCIFATRLLALQAIGRFNSAQAAELLCGVAALAATATAAAKQEGLSASLLAIELLGRMRPLIEFVVSHEAERSGVVDPGSGETGSGNTPTTNLPPVFARHSETTQTLKSILTGSGFSQARFAAITALERRARACIAAGRASPETAVLAEFAGAVQQPAEFRAAAIQAIGNARDKSHLPLLRTLASTDPSTRVRAITAAVVRNLER